MTNKEKYKQAFSTLHASDNIDKEVIYMEQRKHTYIKKIVAAGAAILLATGSITAAYAADLGGIQQKLTMWFQGEQTEVTAKENGDYSYTYTFTDQDGKEQEFTAGGVTIDDAGNEHAVSAQEILDEMTDDVIYTDTGRILFFHYNLDEKIDITDMFDQNGICRIAIKDGEQTVYYQIKQENGENAGYSSTTETPKHPERYTLINE